MKGYDQRSMLRPQQVDKGFSCSSFTPFKYNSKTLTDIPMSNTVRYLSQLFQHNKR